MDRPLQPEDRTQGMCDCFLGDGAGSFGGVRIKEALRYAQGSQNIFEVLAAAIFYLVLLFLGLDPILWETLLNIYIDCYRGNALLAINRLGCLKRFDLFSTGSRVSGKIFRNVGKLWISTLCRPWGEVFPENRILLCTQECL